MKGGSCLYRLGQEAERKEAEAGGEGSGAHVQRPRQGGIFLLKPKIKTKQKKQEKRQKSNWFVSVFYFRGFLIWLST